VLSPFIELVFLFVLRLHGRVTGRSMQSRGGLDLLLWPRKVAIIFLS